MMPTHRKPTSPGKILLEEFLIPLKISQMDFVQHLGGSWTQPKLSAIINGRRAITEEIALDFADALGTSPEFWLGLQSDIRLWEASQRHRKIRRITRIAKRVRVPKSRMRSRLMFR
jgi:addiction module HigA family antidote